MTDESLGEEYSCQRNSRCKGPESGLSLLCPRKSEEEARGSAGEQVGGEVKAVRRPGPVGLYSVREPVALTQRWAPHDSSKQGSSMMHFAGRC